VIRVTKRANEPQQTGSYHVKREVIRFVVPRDHAMSDAVLSQPGAITTLAGRVEDICNKFFSECGWDITFNFNHADSVEIWGVFTRLEQDDLK